MHYFPDFSFDIEIKLQQFKYSLEYYSFSIKFEFERLALSNNDQKILLEKCMLLSVEIYQTHTYLSKYSYVNP